MSHRLVMQWICVYLLCVMGEVLRQFAHFQHNVEMCLSISLSSRWFFVCEWDLNRIAWTIESCGCNRQKPSSDVYNIYKFKLENAQLSQFTAEWRMYKNWQHQRQRQRTPCKSEQPMQIFIVWLHTINKLYNGIIVRDTNICINVFVSVPEIYHAI